MHDGCPTACVGDAAFAYVNAFNAHAALGFFHGDALADPGCILEGAGKRMRHVKLRPGRSLNEKALQKIIAAAYADIVSRRSEDPMKKPTTPRAAASSDWRQARLDEIRTIIKSAVPGVSETRKWKKPSNPKGVPVFEKDGILCTAETYKDKVKLTFSNGAALADPTGLFNASLDGNQRRAIDIGESDKISAKALKALFRAAADLNAAKSGAPKTAKRLTARKATGAKKKS